MTQILMGDPVVILKQKQNLAQIFNLRVPIENINGYAGSQKNCLGTMYFQGILDYAETFWDLCSIPKFMAFITKFG